MTQAYSFSKEGARRIVNAVRAVEANDPLSSRTPGRRRPPGGGPEQFIIARVTEIDAADPLFASATEQYWSEDSLEFIDLPGGRVWDGAEGNPPKVRSVDGQVRGLDALVTLGFRHGADGEGVWYVVPEYRGFFHGKVNASSGITHTVAELDASGNVIAGGRTPTDAEALSGRQDVPVDTRVIVFDLGPITSDGDPVYRFIVDEEPGETVGTTVIDELIVVTPSSSTGTTTIDADDYSGKFCKLSAINSESSEAGWFSVNRTGVFREIDFQIQTTGSTDLTLFTTNTGYLTFFIDASDGHKLKVTVNSAPGIFNEYVRLTVRKTQSIAAATVEL